MELSDSDIKKVIQSYEKKRQREKIYYHEQKKNNEDFKLKNRERAKEHYLKNKDKRKDKYDENKELLQIKSLISYYKKHDRINEFMTKYPEKVEIIGKNHILLN